MNRLPLLNEGVGHTKVSAIPMFNPAQDGIRHTRSPWCKGRRRGRLTAVSYPECTQEILTDYPIEASDFLLLASVAFASSDSGRGWQMTSYRVAGNTTAESLS